LGKQVEEEDPPLQIYCKQVESEEEAASRVMEIDLLTLYVISEAEQTGKLTENIIACMPERRVKDMILLDISDEAYHLTIRLKTNSSFVSLS